MKNKTLYIFNLATDENSFVLASTIDWIKYFSSKVKQVEVYSTHVGKYNLPANVRVRELGGGTLRARIIAISRLRRAFLEISRNKDAMVFHHMSEKTAAFLGLLLSIKRVPQALWYSHSKRTITLFLAQLWVDFIFSTNKQTYPFKSRKLEASGHGIDVSQFITESGANRTSDTILSVGRVAPIKKLENLLISLGQVDNNKLRQKIKIDFIGPINDVKYHSYLTNLAEDQGIQVKFVGPIKHELMANIYRHYSVYFSGTPKSIDKATIEAAISGCLIVTANTEALKSLGMNEIAMYKNKVIPSGISNQLEALLSMSSEEIAQARKIVSEYSSSTNSLEITTNRIIRRLESL